MAIRADILRACVAATSTDAQRRALAPARVCVSARLLAKGTLHHPSERFCLPASDAEPATTELVEFHWRCDTPHDIRIVRAQAPRG